MFKLKKNKRDNAGKNTDKLFPTNISNRYEILNDESIQDIGKKSEKIISPPKKGNFLKKVYINHKINDEEPIIKQSKTSSTEHIKVSIFSDSQGRNLSKYIEQRSCNIKVTGTVMPNAKFQQIIETALNSTQNDAIVLLGGTNNVLQDDLNSIYKFLENSLLMLSNKAPVILCTIPHRYDLNVLDPINDKINLINGYIKELALRIKSTYIVDLDWLTISDHTGHGLHLNEIGKIKIGRQILNILATIFSKKFNKENINYVFGNMKHVINKFQLDKSVAFAHCISSDFGSAKQLSAGVATAFRDIFGKPKQSDCLSESLSFQRYKNGCAVYGLVTKQRYFDKPSEESYNKAFEALIEDFKLHKFESLVCSPMGCIRDGMQPEVFARNIVKFQIETSAPVNIIAYNKLPFKKLRNGYTYNNLIQTIQNMTVKLYAELKEPPLENDKVAVPADIGERLTIDVITLNDDQSSPKETRISQLPPSDQTTTPSDCVCDMSESLNLAKNKINSVSCLKENPKINSESVFLAQNK